jgi:hypothetical protein
MILTGAPRAAEPVACRGLLVIGDPHVGSRRPGRRRDARWPDAILAKLEHCVALANARDLAPILLGDLFEHPAERDIGLMSRLIRILRGFRIRPLGNAGNHDMAHTRLGDGDSLAMLGLADVLDVAAASGPAARFRIDGRLFGLGMTPFGEAVPGDVRGAFAAEHEALWFTHHDIAFGASYPGAVPPFAIAGCGLAVNGHVHTRQEMVVAGATRWANPGTINRISVDLIDHVPAAWVLDAAGELAAETLPHEAEIFDLTGRLVEAARGRDVAADVESAFVSLLSAESATDLGRSDDGSLVAEAIAAKFARDATPAPVQAVIRSLLAEAVERQAGAAKAAV